MEEVHEYWFSHEKLSVYQETILAIAWLADILEKPIHFGDMKDQLERASSSVALNTAEGNGKFLAKDRCRFFDIAHASALEWAAALDVLVARRKLTPAQIIPGKQQLKKIVNMLLGLIKKNSTREYSRLEPDGNPNPNLYPNLNPNLP